MSGVWCIWGYKGKVLFTVDDLFLQWPAALTPSSSTCWLFTCDTGKEAKVFVFSSQTVQYKLSTSSLTHVQRMSRWSLQQKTPTWELQFWLEEGSEVMFKLVARQFSLMVAKCLFLLSHYFFKSIIVLLHHKGIVTIRRLYSFKWV